MIVSVEFRARRILRSASRFKFVEGPAQLSQLDGIRLPFTDSELLLGAYINLPDQLELLLLVTNLSIHFWKEGRWKSLKYADIALAKWIIPYELKQTAHTVALVLDNGAVEYLTILGHTEFGPDSGTFIRFINRVIIDSGRDPLPPFEDSQATTERIVSEVAKSCRCSHQTDVGLMSHAWNAATELECSAEYLMLLLSDADRDILRRCAQRLVDLHPQSPGDVEAEEMKITLKACSEPIPRHFLAELAKYVED